MWTAGVVVNPPKFETAKAQLALNEAAIKPLGEVIRAHGLGNKVSVSLLHKHFNLYEDELLVRNFENNALEIKPESGTGHRTLPYMWSFSKLRAEDDLSVYPVEFIGKKDETAEYANIADSVLENEAFLKDFSAKLKELHVENTFGLSLIPHGLFQIPAKHTLFETDDISNRRLNISMKPLDEIEAIETTRTLFMFPTEESLELEDMSVECGVHCGVHCGIHCGVHCGIHCGIHF
ncbi:MAG: hypothetical protein IH874_07395 [Candidatus Dadabacteria bacterium]|nr:hypothetical protein [Candidatus Dadabacteria bacterium]